METLQGVAAQLGFAWIKLWLASANVSMLANGIQRREISCKRGLREGDPLSPLIFILTAPSGSYLTLTWVCKCEEFGGLGVINLRDFNKAALLKWLWRLF